MTRILRRLLFCLLGLMLVTSEPVYAQSELQVIKDVSYLGETRKHKLDIYLPPNSQQRLRPAVVVVHGGAWVVGSKNYGFPADFARRIAPLGYVVVCPSYQLTEYRFENGKWVPSRKSGPQNIRDVLDAVSFVRRNAGRYGVDPSRIALAGDSAGGQLALLAAYGAKDPTLGVGRLYPETDASVSCVVDFYGPSNFQTFVPYGAWNFLPPELDGNDAARHETVRKFSPVTYIGPGSVPTLIVHGRQDPVVPVAQSEELAAKLKAHQVTHHLVVVEDNRHAFNFDVKEVDLVQQVSSFLARHLAPA